MGRTIPSPELINQRVDELENELNRLKALLTALMAGFAEHAATSERSVQHLLLQIENAAGEVLPDMNAASAKRKGVVELARVLLQRVDPRKPDA